MMRHDANNPNWEAFWWDDYLREFGVDAYYQARYQVKPKAQGEVNDEVVYSTTEACRCGAVHPC